MCFLQLKGITLYPHIAPAKQIVHWREKIVFENKCWIKIWITKCNNFYFICSEDHPISQYTHNHPLLLLAHFFYNLYHIKQKLDEKSISLIAKFREEAISYLKKMSKDSFVNSMIDPALHRFYTEHGVTVEVSPFLLSNFIWNIAQSRSELEQLKTDVGKMQTDFQKTIATTFAQIMEKLNVPKKSVEVQTNIQKPSKTFATQTVGQVSVWEKRMEKQKTMATTQTQTDKEKIATSDKSEQTNIVDTRDSQISELQKTNRKLEKQIAKLNSEIEDTALQSSEDMAILLRKQKEELQKDKEMALSEYRVNFVKYMMENQLTHKEMIGIFLYSDVKVVIDCMQVWMIRWSVKYYYLQLHHCSKLVQPDSFATDNPKFCQFWKDIAIPVANRSKHPIFKVLIREWINLHKTIKVTNQEISDEHLDIAFSNFCTRVINGEMDTICLTPLFFTTLFKNCRNIPILLGMIGIYLGAENKEKVKKILFEDFEKVFTVDTPMQILEKNADILDISDETRKYILS